MWQTIRKFLNLIIFIYILTYPILVFYKKVTLELGLYCSSALLLIAINNLSRLKEFNIFGNSLKLYETIKDAKNKIKEIQELAELFSEVIVHNTTWMNKFGKDVNAINDYIFQIKKYLKKIGTPSKNIKKITSLYFEMTLKDFANSIYSTMTSVYANKISIATVSGLQKIQRNDAKIKPYTPEELEKLFKIYNEKPLNEIDERNINLIKKGISDYKYYIKTQKIKKNSYYKEKMKLRHGYYNPNKQQKTKPNNINNLFLKK